MQFFQKMKGSGMSPPRVSLVEVCWSWIGSFLGIAAVALIHYRLVDDKGLVMLLVALVVNNIPRTRKYPEFWL